MTLHSGDPWCTHCLISSMQTATIRWSLLINRMISFISLMKSHTSSVRRYLSLTALITMQLRQTSTQTINRNVVITWWKLAIRCTTYSRFKSSTSTSLKMLAQTMNSSISQISKKNASTLTKVIMGCHCTISSRCWQSMTEFHWNSTTWTS
jgi:hypothetical protein